MSKDLESSASLPWLVRLRWLTALGQAAALLTARVGFDEAVNWHLALIPFGLTILSNVALATWNRTEPLHSSSLTIGSILVLDIVLLTLLLGASGSAMNPFSVLYLVHITLAAVVLGSQWTTIIAVLAIMCFGSLFLWSGIQHAGHGQHHQLSGHLQGMWVAFALAAALISYYVSRIATTISHQREELASLRERAERSRRTTSLTTLAAGAAHELSTPLATIAVAADEARRAISSSVNLDNVTEDLHLILDEVERCHDILRKLSGSWELGLANANIATSDIPEALLRRLDPSISSRVHIELGNNIDHFSVPREHTLRSLGALVSNAVDASASSDKRIIVHIGKQDECLVLSVEDCGTGMPTDILEHAGDPFFTTKEPGRGMGLGLFLVRAFAESLGGKLELESQPQHGTRASLYIPLSMAETA